MKLLIESLGTLSDRSSQVVNLESNQIITFDFLGSPVTVSIDNVIGDVISISTSHKFSIEKNGRCSLLSAFNNFEIPLNEETIITMPTFDASFKLKFSAVKEMD